MLSKVIGESGTIHELPLRFMADMKRDRNKIGRRSIRLREYDYSSPGAYFVTICTHNRECIFGEIVGQQMNLSPFGEIVNKYWSDLPNHYHGVNLDEIRVMPNHLHGIILIIDNHIESIKPVGVIHELPLRGSREQADMADRRRMLIPKIIGRFKMTSAKAINELRKTLGVPVWQRNYYDM